MAALVTLVWWMISNAGRAGASLVALTRSCLCPDMTSKRHAVTARHWLKRAPPSFWQSVWSRGYACGFHCPVCSGQRALVVLEPCMRDPLMITPLHHDGNLHVKVPAPHEAAAFQGRGRPLTTLATEWLH